MTSSARVGIATLNRVSVNRLRVISLLKLIVKGVGMIAHTRSILINKQASTNVSVPIVLAIRNVNPAIAIIKLTNAPTHPKSFPLVTIQLPSQIVYQEDLIILKLKIVVWVYHTLVTINVKVGTVISVINARINLQ